MRMKSSRISIFSLLIFLWITSFCNASFFLYFKDGSYREVNKVEFKGQFVELYLTAGTVLRMPKNSIDYRASGIEEPSESDNKLILKGPRPDQRIVVAPEKKATGPTQEELGSEWGSTTTNAVAIHDFGSLKKGEIVRIVSNNNIKYTIIAKMEDGSYKRLTVNSDNFMENFEIKTVSTLSTREPLPEKDAKPSVLATAPEPHSPTISPVAPVASPVRRSSLVWPFLSSVALLAFGLLSTMILSKLDQRNHKSIKKQR